MMTELKQLQLFSPKCPKSAFILQGQQGEGAQSEGDIRGIYLIRPCIHTYTHAHLHTCSFCKHQHSYLHPLTLCVTNNFYQAGLIRINYFK